MTSCGESFEKRAERGAFPVWAESEPRGFGPTDYELSVTSIGEELVFFATYIAYSDLSCSSFKHDA